MMRLKRQPIILPILFIISFVRVSYCFALSRERYDISQLKEIFYLHYMDDRDSLLMPLVSRYGRNGFFFQSPIKSLHGEEVVCSFRCDTMDSEGMFCLYVDSISRDISINDTQSEEVEWISGTNTIFYNPSPFMGKWVTCSLRDFENRGGRVISQNYVSPDYFGYLFESFAYGGNDWIDRLRGENILLCHDINLLWEKQNVQAKRNETYTLLLYVDEGGSIEIEPLLPTSLDKNQWKLLRKLKKVIKRLPKGCLTNLYTIENKIFPCRYYYASYKSSINKWLFIDYMAVNAKNGRTPVFAPNFKWYRRFHQWNH